jgi:hypothetical protein
MHDSFDYDDVHVQLGNLVEDSMLISSSILMQVDHVHLKALQCPMTWMKKQKLHGKF